VCMDRESHTTCYTGPNGPLRQNLRHWHPYGDHVLPTQDPRDVPATLNIGNQHTTSPALTFRRSPDPTSSSARPANTTTKRFPGAGCHSELNPRGSVRKPSFCASTRGVCITAFWDRCSSLFLLPGEKLVPKVRSSLWIRVDDRISQSWLPFSKHEARQPQGGQSYRPCRVSEKHTTHST
jgi:hypothetical protein